MNINEYRNFISTFASIVTIILFLSGSEICLRIIKQRSTGDVSGFPFIGGAFSTSVWLLFSFIVKDTPMLITNTVGLTLQIIYLIIYARFCISIGPWKAFRKQMSVLSILISAIICYTFVYGQSKDKLEAHIGLICCSASIFFTLTPLASLKDVFRTQSTEVLPLPLIFSLFLVGGSWGLYGLIIENIFVSAPNIIGCIIAIIELSLFVIYPRKIKEPLLAA